MVFSDQIEVSEDQPQMDDTLEGEAMIEDEPVLPIDYQEYRSSTPVSVLSEDDPSSRSGAFMPQYSTIEDPPSPQAGINRSESPL